VRICQVFIENYGNTEHKGLSRPSSQIEQNSSCFLRKAKASCDLIQKCVPASIRLTATPPCKRIYHLRNSHSLFNHKPTPTVPYPLRSLSLPPRLFHTPLRSRIVLHPNKPRVPFRARLKRPLKLLLAPSSASELLYDPKSKYIDRGRG
jgi:hypothetical protein